MTSQLIRRKRNILLLTAVILLILAVVHKPSLAVFFLKLKGICHVFFMAILSFCIAIGFHQMAKRMLRDNGIAWYTRPGGFMAMILIFVFSGILVTLIGTYIIPLTGSIRFFTEKAYIYELFGMTIIWIVSLE